ncbi:hypothetical protein E2C01_085870 [Portunus trituberculatus]|uniref:Uncharacterized protein n=1 Tax=Portunus trituberculatus TaxID=210409 RepID=A0A5B7JA15_PORTR|nr:hypothetical protein [Portunus trituberculatus]
MLQGGGEGRSGRIVIESCSYKSSRFILTFPRWSKRLHEEEEISATPATRRPRGLGTSARPAPSRRWEEPAERIVPDWWAKLHPEGTSEGSRWQYLGGEGDVLRDVDCMGVWASGCGWQHNRINNERVMSRTRHHDDQEGK